MNFHRLQLDKHVAIVHNREKVNFFGHSTCLTRRRYVVESRGFTQLSTPKLFIIIFFLSWTFKCTLKKYVMMVLPFLWKSENSELQDAFKLEEFLLKAQWLINDFPHFIYLRFPLLICTMLFVHVSIINDECACMHKLTSYKNITWNTEKSFYSAFQQFFSRIQ